MSAVHDKVHITDEVLIFHAPDILDGLVHIKAFPGTGTWGHLRCLCPSFPRQGRDLGGTLEHKRSGVRKACIWVWAAA